MNLQITRDTIAGSINIDAESSISFTEWWNGEGLDFNFSNGDECEMSKDELLSICSLAIYLGFVNEKTLKENIEKFRTQEKQNL